MAGVRGITENFLWNLEGSSISHSHFLCPTPPKNAILPQPPLSPKLPPQESGKVTSEVSDPADSKAELALEASTAAELQASEVAIPAHMIPLHLQLGGIKRVYRCQVEGCTEGPST